MTRRVSIAIAIVLLAVPAALAWGNMAAPPEPLTLHSGSRLGEPAGALAGVAIEHETLDIDLRPLKAEKPALVEAVYRVRNDGPARTLDLLFVANGLARGSTVVSVDGRPVSAAPGTAGALPASWRAPAATPAPEGAPGAIPYEPRSEGTLAFRAALPAGRHEIRVRYPAEASVYSRNELTPVWQLGYVLAPARDWASFGTLDVRVRVPRGWTAGSSIPLQRRGSELTGSFRGVPADALALAVQRPRPSMMPLVLLWVALSAALLVCFGWLSRRMGMALGRRGKSSAWAFPAVVVMTIAWTVLVVLGYSSMPSLVKWWIGPYAGEYAIRAMSYGDAMFLLLLVPFMLLVGLTALQAAAFSGRKHARAAAPASS
jgi:hypothetical protein